MNSNPIRILWLLTGVSLLAIIGALWPISLEFVYGSAMVQRPILLITALLMVAALVYFVPVAALRFTLCTSPMLFWMIAVGIAARLLLFPSNPILEDDYYRYLWDGGITAHGHNPYRYIPENVQDRNDGVGASIIELGEESGVVLERVNHPWLGTIYPPVTQAVFAVAHWIAPWKLWGLRLVFLGCDLALLFFLIQLLRHFEAPPLQAVIYWWNPLLIKAFYNSTHMDVIVALFATAALYMAVKSWPFRTGATLALATAAKLWPIILAPLFLWPWLKNMVYWKRQHTAGQPGRRSGIRDGLVATLTFMVLTAALLAPTLTAAPHGDSSGFAAYGKQWEMNDALYMVFPWAAKHTLALFNADPTAQQLHYIGRAIAMLIVVAVLAWVTLCRSNTAQQLAAACLAVTATLFLVSPTQFPWYYAWLLPFLALRPRWSLLLLTLMLPMYYLKFYYAAWGEADFFHYRLVWLEFAPVWALLAWEGWQAWREKIS